MGIKDFDHFANHFNMIIEADKYIGRSLFGLENKEWREMRSSISPIFTSSKMKMMFGLLSDQAKDFVSYFEERSNKGDELGMS